MQDNAAPLQHHPEYYLCVPGSGPTSLLATVPREGADRGLQVEMLIANPGEPEHSSLPNDACGTQPMRVFSPSLFTDMVCRVFFGPIPSTAVLTIPKIEAASQEREVMPHLLRSLYKRVFSACVGLPSVSSPVSADHPHCLSRLPPQATLVTVCTPVIRQRSCLSFSPAWRRRSPGAIPRYPFSRVSVGSLGPLS